MPVMSSAAWAVHDVGLATAIGGTLFGRAALEPAVNVITSPMERDRVSADAWKRFSWLNLAAHVAFAAPWFIGRSMLSGREVSARAKSLTHLKDGLVIASLLTGVSSIFLGRALGKRAEEGMGPEELSDRAGQESTAKKLKGVEKTVGVLGLLNLAANIGIMSVTALLAMQSSKSVKFPAWSRRLP